MGGGAQSSSETRELGNSFYKVLHGTTISNIQRGITLGVGAQPSMTGVDWGKVRSAGGHIYLQMQLGTVTLGTSQKLLEKLAFSIMVILLCVLLEFCADKNTHKAPFLSQFQIKRHQAASPPSTASSGVSESRAQESFHMSVVRTQLQLGKMVSSVYEAMPHAPSSLLRGRPQRVQPPVSRG